MKNYSHKFVHFMPDKLDADVIYVSLEFSQVTHVCACGCGEEIVTPLGPREWQLIFNGETVSLFPSIGNWRLRCRSHYWIEQNRAVRITDLRKDGKSEQIESKAAPWQRFGSITELLWSKLKWWSDND